MANINIKCKNCGSVIEINEDSDVVTCPVCHATNYINYTKNTSDDNEILFDFVVLKNPFRVFFISILIIFILTVTVIGITFIKYDNNKDIKANSTTDTTNTITTEGISTPDEQYETEFFNNKYSIYEGIKGNGILIPIINSIIQTNSLGEHTIVVDYNGEIYKDEQQLNTLISIIDKSKTSNISFNYDNEGYINTIIIDEVEV